MESDGGGSTTAIFTCQRCDVPLKLSTALMSPDTLDQLLLDKRAAGAAAGGNLPQGAWSANSSVRPAGLSEPVHSSRSIASCKPPAEALSREEGGRTSLFYVTQAAQQLFDLSSSAASVDHPLCEECTDGLLDELDERLREVEDENRACSEFLAKYSAKVGAGELEATQAELEELQAQEAQLVESLGKVEVERESIKGELRQQEEEFKALDEHEEQYWTVYHEHQRGEDEFYAEQLAVEHQYQQAYGQLEKLKKTNVFNDAFHIWHDGHFGTINSFRLGRLPSVPVEWNEINAAWGHTVLLLHTMALRLNFKFSRYRLIPSGSHSRLERIDDSAKELPLYGSGGFKLFWDSKFDQAMVSFLECLQQFKQHVEVRDKHFKLPYKIEKDKIGDSNGKLSIRIQSNHEETWTKALKYMLTNLKWCLAWVCKQTPG